MKKILLLFFAFFATYFLYSQDVYVNGYNTSNGTYVESHYRTAPNSTINDNYSTVGNVNPYTGKAGIVARDYNYSAYQTKTFDYLTPPPNPPHYDIDFDPQATANLATPKYVPPVVSETPTADLIVGKLSNPSTEDRPDYNPDNGYFFGKSVATPEKGSLITTIHKEPEPYSNNSTMQFYNKNGEFLEGVAIAIIIIISLFIIASKARL